MAGPNHIYLSPHHDDIAFSLGALVAKQPGGVLVNLFTRSAFVSGVSWQIPPVAEAIERITALRRAEDEAFAARFGLERLDLGLDEPSLGGRDPFAASGVGGNAELLRGPLVELLGSLLARGPARLFCPSGIGGHVDHLATQAIVLELLPKIGSSHDVLFYEDLPYAASRRRRLRGLVNLRVALGGRPILRSAWRAGAEKLAAVRLYPSQFKSLPTSLLGFSPWAPSPIGPHEAVWSITTS